MVIHRLTLVFSCPVWQEWRVNDSNLLEVLKCKLNLYLIVLQCNKFVTFWNDLDMNLCLKLWEFEPLSGNVSLANWTGFVSKTGIFQITFSQTRLTVDQSENEKSPLSCEEIKFSAFQLFQIHSLGKLSLHAMVEILYFQIKCWTLFDQSKRSLFLGRPVIHYLNQR